LDGTTKLEERIKSLESITENLEKQVKFIDKLMGNEKLKKEFFEN
jgi:hypothetical protein